MSKLVVIEGAKMYANTVIREPLINSVFAALCNPSVFKYSKFGKETAVREITAGTASNYRGKFEQGGTGGKAVWTSFTALNDRSIVFSVDAMDEYNAILEGMTLSGVEIAKMNLVNLASEIDAVTAAKIYNSLNSTNKISSADLKVDSVNIWDTLTKLENKIYNKGYKGEIYTFIKASTFAEMTLGLITNNALANSAVLTLEPVKGIKIDVNVYRFNNMVLFRVPDDRMKTLVNMLDGFSVGQEAGGYVVDADADDIEILAVPPVAAALSVRHNVNNLLVPNEFLVGVNPAQLQAELAGVNNLTDNTVAFQNVGVNQSADAFEYQTRLIYDSVMFNTWKDTIFAVYTPKVEG